MKLQLGIAGEILMENLLERLMQVALINAGGHKASLILNTDDALPFDATQQLSGGSCAVVGGRGGAWLALMLLGLVAVRRRWTVD